MKDVGGAVLAGSTPPFLGRERAAVDVDVGPERRSPRYHETCLALESVEEGSAAVSEPRCVWLRVHIVKDLEKARRLPVRVEEQQAQQLAMNPPRSAGDGRQEIQLTAMVPIELPVLGNLACRLLVEVLVRAAGVKANPERKPLRKVGFTKNTVRQRGMGTPLMGTILEFASVPLRKMGTDLLGSWRPCQCVLPTLTS